jgi:hypothetical protein
MIEITRTIDGKVVAYGGKPVTIAPNGYHYCKDAKGKRRLLHHLVAEETLGREIRSDERVSFKDKDRTNFDPENIVVKEAAKSKKNRIEYLEARIRADTEELEELRASLTTRV